MTDRINAERAHSCYVANLIDERDAAIAKSDTIGDLQAVLLRRDGAVSVTRCWLVAWPEKASYRAYWAHVDGRSRFVHGATLEAAVRALVELLGNEEAP